MLTKKEIEILRLRKQGLKQSEIAKKLKISQHAVSRFENNVIKKVRDAKEILEIANEIRVYDEQ